jgi:hypothetical protein
MSVTTPRSASWTWIFPANKLASCWGARPVDDGSHRDHCARRWQTGPALRTVFLRPGAEGVSANGHAAEEAAVYIEMFKAINTGVLAAQEPRSRDNATPTSFETFVHDVFAPAYHGKARVA